MKHHFSKSVRFALAFTLLLTCAFTLLRFPAASESNAHFPFKLNDRVAWIGSSSTRIGTWCRTMEFLLRTRHPELNLTFTRCTTGGGTFLTGIKQLPVWLNDFKPTYVLYNYGGNDAGSGAKGLPQFKLNMQKCYEVAKEAGARVEFMTHQSGDVRVTAALPFDNRKLYAESMLDFAHEKEWTIYDTHHPLESFQINELKDVPDFTINRDRIHLTDSAYVAWGFFLYERMNPPVVESAAELSADGKIVAQTNCRISNVVSDGKTIEFTRADSVLPVLPPEPIPAGTLKLVSPSAGGAAGAAIKDATKDLLKPATATKTDLVQKLTADLTSSTAVATTPPHVSETSAGAVAGTVVIAAANAPQSAKAPAAPAFKIPQAQLQYVAKHGQELPPRKLAPLEKHSRYMLKIGGLADGDYKISCDGKPLGSASAKELADGVNLNSVLLDSKNSAPWGDLAKDIWQGKRVDEIGKTQFKFKVEKN